MPAQAGIQRLVMACRRGSFVGLHKRSVAGISDVQLLLECPMRTLQFKQAAGMRRRLA